MRAYLVDETIFTTSCTFKRIEDRRTYTSIQKIMQLHIASTLWRTKIEFSPRWIELACKKPPLHGMSQRYIRCIAVDDSLPVFPEKHFVWTHVFPGFTCSLGPFITSSSGPTQSVRNMRLLLQSTGTLLKETPHDLLNYFIFNKGISVNFFRIPWSLLHTGTD